MALCPDFSDSDDGMSDDGDYYEFKERVKVINRENIESRQEGNRESDIKSLFSVLSSGNAQVTAEYFDKGIDVNVDIQDGWTPLLLAASYGNPDITRELIKRNVDVNLDRDGFTPLMMACNCPNTTSSFDKSFDVVQQLVESNANVKAMNRKRMTALMFAANVGNLKAVEFLLPLSDKNAEDNQRWTALFWAVNNNQVDVVKYLLSEEFEYTKVDVRSNTPLDIAKNYGFQQIIELFPKEDSDTVDMINSHFYSFEEHFIGLKNGEKPRFFLDVYNILCGVRTEAVSKILSEKNVGLYDILSTSDEELKQLGVKLPYQRSRIMGGLYRFHKCPFHPKSLHSVPLKEVYSNIDMAIQILSTIKQVIAMEASLVYIMKHYSDERYPKESMPLLAKNISSIKCKTANCKGIVKKLRRKTEMMDNKIQPADLITSKSKTYFLPWRKIVFSFSVISLVLIFKVIK